MAKYALTVETTNNNTAGASASNTVAQMLMGSSRDARLVAVMVEPQNQSGTQTPGQWVVDRISAVGSGSSLVPLKMNPYSRASEITDTAKTISTTVAATNTVVDAAIVILNPGWNYFTKQELDIRAGAAQGFAVRRATAPSGAQVVDVTLIWEEL